MSGVQYTTVAYSQPYEDKSNALDEWHAISLDDFIVEAFNALGRNHDSPASHYAAFHCNRKHAINRFVYNVRLIAEKMMYRSDDYGYPEDKTDA
jgi:hypothetical protein